MHNNIILSKWKLETVSLLCPKVEDSVIVIGLVPARQRSPEPPSSASSHSERPHRRRNTAGLQGGAQSNKKNTSLLFELNRHFSVHLK